MTIKKYIYIFVAMVLTAMSLQAQELVFAGFGEQPIAIKPTAATGLHGIYVLENAAGVKASLAGAPTVTWYKYGNYGAAHAEEIGASAEIILGTEDAGYVAEQGTTRYYFWVTNYANHQLVLNGINPADEQDCDRTRLSLQGNAAPIYYYGINGQRHQLDRQMQLKYNTLTYDETSEMYVQTQQEEEIASIDGEFSVPAPLCDTYFTLSGDRFLAQWGKAKQVESAMFSATAVEAHTTAIQEVRDNANEQNVETDGLGGSAPCLVHFSAQVTDAAIFYEWQISRDPEFETIDDRYRQLDFDFTFRDNGTTYVRFVANNSAGTCEYIGETYQVFIGDSMLLCPNAFSPGASEGVNDEWRVSYKSIVKYECHIFNRWGQELFSSTDPGAGWDGKYKGKLVPTGAYYYVIKAVGSDGRKYNLSGDINILHSRQNSQGSTVTE